MRNKKFVPTVGTHLRETTSAHCAPLVLPVQRLLLILVNLRVWVRWVIVCEQIVLVILNKSNKSVYLVYRHPNNQTLCSHASLSYTQKHKWPTTFPRKAAFVWVCRKWGGGGGGGCCGCTHLRKCTLMSRQQPRTWRNWTVCIFHSWGFTGSQSVCLCWVKSSLIISYQKMSEETLGPVWETYFF